MFFSDDLLTGKKGSLGVIWLMATLGPRNKRINRKTLAAVEISRSCEIIAEPPEPMALRLSGHLLVGVTRLYHQSYETFYSDVQNFDATLRRSIETKLKTTANGRTIAVTSGGIDLPNGGKSRLDQITFPTLDDTEFVNFDFEFGHINWANPLVSSRKRRASSKLSSLLADGDEEQSERSDQSDEDELVVRKRKRTDTPQFRYSATPQPRFGDGGFQVDDVIDSQDNMNYEPIDLGILDTLDGFGNSDGPSDPSNRPMDDMGDIFMGNDFNANPNMDFGGEIQPIEEAQPAAKELQPEADKDGKKRSANNDSESDVEEVIAPDVKKKRVRKIKAVEFDESLEVGVADTQDYEEAMAEQRAEAASKKKEQLAQVKATAMVDGAGLWLEFTDPGMSGFFSTISKVDKFKWELDVSDHRSGKKKDSDKPEDIIEDDPSAAIREFEPDMNMDIGNPEGFQMPDQDFNLQQDLNFQLQDHVNTEADVEQVVPRVNNGLPWDDPALDDHSLDLPLDMGASVTPSSRRFSVMTPLEARLRSVSASKQDKARGNRRSRSGSLASNMHMNEDLMLTGDDNELPLEELDLEELDGQRPHPADAFSPAMLATLDSQCRHFFSYLETRMVEAQTDEIELTHILPAGATKRVAAAAFYNCLNLATKRILSLSQDEHCGPIGIRIAATA